MTLTTYALLTDDDAESPDDRTPTPAPPVRRRRRRRVRTAVLTAGLAIAALVGTACEPAPSCLGDPATIVGTAGDDRLRGTSGPDVIVGLGGRDVIQGLSGHDRLCGGAGNDQIYAGEGNDIVDGGVGGDVVTGDSGTDTLDYSGHAKAVSVDLLTGRGPEGDILGTFENINGTSHDDVLVGDDGPNGLSGGHGSDLMRGMGGPDRLVDYLASRRDRNTFEGGSGSDVMQGGAETLNDIVTYDDSTAPVFVNLGNQRASGFGEDELVGMDGAVGSRFADIIYGSPRKDFVYGGAGDDLLVPFGGDDTINGMGGRDRVSYYAASSVDVDLASGRASGEGTDVITDVEDVQGGRGLDYLAGTSGPNTIDGGAGQDLCVGAGGADSLIRCP